MASKPCLLLRFCWAENSLILVLVGCSPTHLIL
uniref:Uncharacterized protein n=1 Tax=Anguilla anguilla TaxID=7936 RepID=A0A0E9RQ64_ANGAN